MPVLMKICGGNPLRGKIEISGAKNAALPLMCTTLLTKDPCVFTNIPNLLDIRTMIELLKSLGVEATFEDNKCHLSAKNITQTEASYDLVSRMRASILVLGPLLSRFGHAKVSLPGGCAIGTRPVDIHLEGLRALGATITISEGYIHAETKQGLKGCNIVMPKVSVTATENLMMAACLATGTTVLTNAAREPEIVDLADCLRSMGATIDGAGTDVITIEGKTSLHGTSHNVMADRVEAGTYAMAALITDGELLINGIDYDQLAAAGHTLISVGAHVEKRDNSFLIRRAEKYLTGRDVMTEPFPGFATDLQAQFMALMSVSQGASMVTETIFENRFMHVQELCRMGANIVVHGSSALVRGIDKLSPAKVMATDLRASVCLILAALQAQGETMVSRIYHLDRGYEDIEGKLSKVGAEIERVRIEPSQAA